jgi:predicted NBD/HSP70 family sugar kinase
MQKVKSLETIAESNKQLILDTLRFNGNMSRADLSRHLGMSFPAVSSNVKGLLDSNHILEVGVGDNSLGRKSTLLSFNTNRGYIIGVDLGRFRIRMILADLLGNEIATSENINDANPLGDGKQSIRLIYHHITEILEEAGKTKDDILCIVIGIPGIIKDGQNFLAPFTEKYSEKDMIETLQEAFEADVILENCVNLGVIGEQWKGCGVNYKDITYIAYGVGLGSAHIVDGKLYKGANCAAGEIGFMVTVPTDLNKKYDEMGSLEETLSIGKYNEIIDSHNFDLEIIKLIEQYQNDESTYAKKVFDKIALNFGIGLVNISALLNPEVIIIAGGLGANLGKLFIDQWKEILNNHLPFAPDLLLSKLNHRESTLGAVMTGIIHIHEYKI